jgi:TolB-like protein
MHYSFGVAPSPMKQCPKCNRIYTDETLNYCLDDGDELVYGPGNTNAETAILTSEAPTRLHTSDEPAPVVSPLIDVRRWWLLLLIPVIGVTGYFTYRYLLARTTQQIDSIAVLPFVNASDNPDIDYLSDGITESLINNLSQVPKLSVKARSSVFTYKGKEISPQQVAKDLSVQAIVNGRVVQRGDQIQLNVELVDARTGNQIWGDHYTRKMTDLVQLQNEIVRDVSGRLKTRLSGTDQQKITKNYTENTEAYQLYLRGRYHWNRRTPDEIKKSVEYFQQAIDKDPTYALAYAGLADAYILMPDYGVDLPKNAYPIARSAAQKAIEIDPSLAEAHNALASILSDYDWKFSEAESEWQTAIELDPNYATAHQWYGEHLMSMGRFPQALDEMKRAQELDPLSLIINGLLGVCYGLNGDGEREFAQLKKTLEIDPNFARTHLFLAEYYQDIGRFEEAIDEFVKYFLLSGQPSEKVLPLAAQVKRAYETGGPKAYARAMAEIFGSYGVGNSGPPPGVLAGYWIQAGEPEKAIDLLEKASQRREGLLMLKSPNLDPIKSDPRFKEILHRVGLPE